MRQALLIKTTPHWAWVGCGEGEREAQGQVVMRRQEFGQAQGLFGMPAMRKQASAQLCQMWTNPTYLYFKTHFPGRIGGRGWILGNHNMLLKSENPWVLVFSPDSTTFSMRKT